MKSTSTMPTIVVKFAYLVKNYRNLGVCVNLIATFHQVPLITVFLLL